MPPTKTTANNQIKEAVDQVLKEAKYEKVEPSAVKTVPVQLDKIRNLRMGLGAMRRIEELTGDSPWDGQSWANLGRDTHKLTIYLWQCLLHEDPELTKEQVEEMEGTELSNIPYLIDRMGMLWGLSMPDPEPETGDGATRPN